MVSQPDLKYFEEKLLDLQEEIMGISDVISHASKPVKLDQNSVGRLSRMDAMQAQAMAQAGQERQQNQLSLISDALERIDDGEFGRCLGCDEFISIARLEIEPTVEDCIHCAQLKESKDQLN